jgi:molecular chaperone DnaK
VNPVVGIDLGTTNSVVSYTDHNGVTEVIAGKDGDRIVPSVVHFLKDGATEVGHRAKQEALTDPERVAALFKRGMGERTFLSDERPFTVDGKTWLPEELSALVLKKLAGMATEHLGEPVRRAVITVPAYFGEPERAATRTAGEIAGLEVLRIVNEPTAAAVAHGLDSPSGRRQVLVFDLGGGTFDVTVMDVGDDGSLEVVTTGGDRRLGGADFDQLIVDRLAAAAKAAGSDLLAEPWSRQDAYATAEEMKKALSTSEEATGRIIAGGRPVAVSATRAEFERDLGPWLQKVEDITVFTLEQADVDPSGLDTVLMVGGSSRIPAFQQLLARISGKEPTFSRNLDEDVARGAAILGAKLGGEVDPRAELARMPMPVDAASHGLGVTVLDPDAGTEKNAIMIPSGTSIPHTADSTFATVDEQQTEIKVRLNEGDDEDLDYVRQLGDTLGRFPRPVRRGHPIRIEMEYTADQLIRVRAFDGESGMFLCDLEVRHEGQMSPREKLAALTALASTGVR